MRQVPAFASYLIIGGGRVARHIRHYLDLESIPHVQWTRQQPAHELRELSSRASHVLVLISDRAVEGFLIEHAYLTQKTCVHFSGSLVTKLAPSAHPLMTFSDKLYDLETYRGIPFVTELGRGHFSDLLPGFQNESYAIELEKKPLYHALCALSGNFTTMLWEKTFNEFETRLRLPREVLKPYLNQITQNLLTLEKGQSVLTGPIVRGDKEVITKHLDALEGDGFQHVYAAFVSAHAAEHAASQDRKGDAT